MQKTHDALCKHMRESGVFESVQALLGWDERTKMPRAAAAFRGEQIKAMAGLIHQRRTDPKVGEWLRELESSDWASDPHSDTGATIRCLRRDYDRHVKLPQALVEALAQAEVVGQQAWQEARENDAFDRFAPHLSEIVKLTIEKANALGFDEHVYDALLDEYEPDARTTETSRVLSDLAKRLGPLVAAVRETGKKAPIEILRQDYNVGIQARFGRQVAETIGFDFERGRLDTTSHPFCESVGPSDCRITTRYNKNWFAGAFFGTLHEAGHGIYEQGLREDAFGLPLGQYVSLGIHESQSRLWENLVGRSLPFWTHFFPKLQAAFPNATSGVALRDFYWAVNSVQPSLIRVEADEATYNLHVAIRFELERDLVDGSLSVAELPDAWNQKYQSYLGIQPSSDADGVLQDIHWSCGLIGYFPTYALGNLYAAQMFDCVNEAIPDLSAQFERGEFQSLRRWLHDNLHCHGRRYSAQELIRRISGRQLDAESLMTYLTGKLHPLFGL